MRPNVAINGLLIFNSNFVTVWGVTRRRGFKANDDKGDMGRGGSKLSIFWVSYILNVTNLTSRRLKESFSPSASAFTCLETFLFRTKYRYRHILMVSQVLSQTDFPLTYFYVIINQKVSFSVENLK